MVRIPIPLQQQLEQQLQLYVGSGTGSCSLAVLEVSTANCVCQRCDYAREAVTCEVSEPVGGSLSLWVLRTLVVDE